MVIMEWKNRKLAICLSSSTDYPISISSTLFERAGHLYPVVPFKLPDYETQPSSSPSRCQAR